MTIQEIFNDITKRLITIKASETTIMAYNSFLNESSNLNIKPIRHFIQIARNPNPQFQGLVIECLIVDEQRLYDIVIGTDNIDINSIWIKDLIKVGIQTIPVISKTKENEQEIVKKEYFAQLLITYSPGNNYFYKTNIERIGELYQLASLLTNMR
ncbi:hypothetical protein FLCU109888_09515 [Flavobacterium cucumis]|uniref:Uncharacterized protein n=1 Tax=Flavobacterium cucumis TaxID=416016 RepID=A0A1M7ZZ83_9FLAO|nr:hypothetical protein [Flavobacterium cucumis]SHO74181.1 hypothetical protein SAMN05443547_2566 [Flavobacterium cucumis]